MWQDWVLSAGSIVFSIALLPMVFGSRKPALSSSFMTGVVLWVFAATYLSLHLTFTTATTAVSALLWTVLFLQALKEST
jgi:hypothetical protein